MIWPMLATLNTIASPIQFPAGASPVPCPYFMPMEKLEGGNWSHPGRLPLGCGWNGYCTAPGHENEIPQPEILETFCNLGYAGPCSWAPVERAWDAVRFAVMAPPPSGDFAKRNPRSSARELRLVYVCERDHHPVQRGDLLFDLAAERWLGKHHDPRIQRMAECFLESYLRKKA